MQVPQDIKIRYLSRRREDITKLYRALERDDYSYPLLVGHQVKGNALTFDLPQMASLGVEMERAAEKRDKELIRHLIQKMEAILQNAQV
jgi:hypothetical protein